MYPGLLLDSRSVSGAGSGAPGTAHRTHHRRSQRTVVTADLVRDPEVVAIGCRRDERRHHHVRAETSDALKGITAFAVVRFRTRRD